MYLKLCNNDTALKWGEKNHDPTYKFDLIYKVINNNINNITKHVYLNLTGEKTTWRHAGLY